jgi:hypothetical protein
MFTARKKTTPVLPTQILISNDFVLVVVVVVETTLYKFIHSIKRESP